MKPLAFVLLALVGSMVLTNLSAPSYADSQLIALLKIATQAQNNIGIQLSQLNKVPNDIKQLYNQGSGETNALAQSISKNDADSAKKHFLSAMAIFKSINYKISSLASVTTTIQPSQTTSNQPSQIDTLRLKDEINRIQKLGDGLKTIATKNKIGIDFTKFDVLMQDASKNLVIGNVNQVNNDLKIAQQFLLDANHSLTEAAKKKR
ncbi:MAG: hypothetical protein E6L05_02010 [Thaumarchaeota archaeon]|nr:MAG: hypothetical protein E6L05_02010 [Nitrososphaerota archaeon]